ncbi:MAG: aconitate hydratase AcnA [Alphaproteobacteria bacterium]|nr:aconitate hydratase AcnA [Alphaproteobacteria bacterium]
MSYAFLDSFQVLKTLSVDGKSYHYVCLRKAHEALGGIESLPYSLKVLLENLLRRENGHQVTKDDIKALSQWGQTRSSQTEIVFAPARVLMQDFTGVPAVVDLAAMRDAVKDQHGNPTLINPLTDVDLVIDHSVMVDAYASDHAFGDNVDLEYERNKERYAFLKWGQSSFNNFRVVPPGTGICHQVNLEYLGKVVWQRQIGSNTWIYPDTLVGTDSHTTMINALGILGWGVGGIEAEAAMLGQPLSMLIPQVVGFELTGRLPEGATATDLVLTVTQMLRAHGVVGKFVEFYGNGLSQLSIADRATISNMAPEYGATCAMFPVDQETLRYLSFTGRDEHLVTLVETYAKSQGLWRDDSWAPIFSQTLHLDLSTIVPTLAGPKRPQDKVVLSQMKEQSIKAIAAETPAKAESVPVTHHGKSFELCSGNVVIAAITSCTNTSNPSVMLGAGLVARKARQLGLMTKPWVKTSLAPGSQVVTDYLELSGLNKDLDALGFNLVGYGCTTCIGNSGPLDTPIANAIDENNLSVASVLSGNRNFEGRIHPQVKLNYLASPMLVVAYALAGTIKHDLTTEPLGVDPMGKPIYLKDIWPTNQEIQECVDSCITSNMFRKRYDDVFKGEKAWAELTSDTSTTYHWQSNSTYVKKPPFFDGMDAKPSKLVNIETARPLALFGDSITTDHISPAGSIKKETPAGQYLISHGITPADFNSYGSRRGNHEVMMRGTFANIRIQNEMVPERTGGYTRYMPSGELMTIYDAAMGYQAQHTPLVIVAGKEYGTGSSRDWAAKGTKLLGIKAVIAESFERIHRSNLVGMGVLPLEFPAGTTRKTLSLTGQETFSVSGITDKLSPRCELPCVITYPDGRQQTVSLKCRIDTMDELSYYQNDGILPYVIRTITQAKAA